MSEKERGPREASESIRNNIPWGINSSECDGMPMQVHRTTYTVMRSVLEDDETRGRSVLSLSPHVIVMK